jgi:hypothetical protein
MKSRNSFSNCNIVETSITQAGGQQAIAPVKGEKSHASPHRNIYSNERVITDTDYKRRSAYEIAVDCHYVGSWFDIHASWGLRLFTATEGEA